MPFACAGHCGLSLVALRRGNPALIRRIFSRNIEIQPALFGLKALPCTALDRNGAQRANEHEWTRA